MKFVPNRPYSDPDKAARKLVEIANSVEAVQDGRIYVELINGPFLFREKGTPDGSGDRAQLAGVGPERNLRPVHTSGLRPVRLNPVATMSYQSRRVRLFLGNAASCQPVKL
jgi:hypothetical protein